VSIPIDYSDTYDICLLHSMIPLSMVLWLTLSQHITEAYQYIATAAAAVLCNIHRGP